MLVQKALFVTAVYIRLEMSSQFCLVMAFLNLTSLYLKFSNAVFQKRLLACQDSCGCPVFLEFYWENCGKYAVEQKKELPKI